MATLVLALAAPVVVVAQISPCNMGRDLQHEPRNPAAICMPLVGRMDDFQGPCSINQGGGQFGNQLAPVGDVDNSGTVDFVVGHRLCDSNLSLRAEELLLYNGVHNGLPSSFGGYRIGPTERNSITKFVAAGDWDADGHIDLAVRVQILGDTSEGNHSGFETSELVIFWGNSLGQFSLNDTSTLASEANMWLGISAGCGADIDGDGVDDLVVTNSDGFSNGAVQKMPWLHAFRGHPYKRWGRDGISRTADLAWWNAPYADLTVIDHDHDGAPDIVFNSNSGDFTKVSVLYGSTDGKLPDTNGAQAVDLRASNSRRAIFSDVTGDGIPELVACSGRDDFVKVFVGFKGQRLLEQYGSGHDTAQPGSGKWWGRPWDTVWLPRRINPEWFGDDDRLFDLGDANLDGVGDIFAFSWPYMVEYNGGSRLDSLVDALIDITPGTEIGILKRLGNIDGSGRDIIALTAGNEIRFYAPTHEISSFGYDHDLPPGTGVAAVERPLVPAAPTLRLAAVPNPSRGEIRFSWSGEGLDGTALITIHDLAGHEVARCDAPAREGVAICGIAGLPAGEYAVRFLCGHHTAATTIAISR
ncbi:MAG TPA: VCBS repeat-containing protein [Candidatus Kapabacteria bacterium]|nr:VCBS repeat-containing protein [Candidatus Kapabacteria bacterium]